MEHSRTCLLCEQTIKDSEPLDNEFCCPAHQLEFVVGLSISALDAFDAGLINVAEIRGAYGKFMRSTSLDLMNSASGMTDGSD